MTRLANILRGFALAMPTLFASAAAHAQDAGDAEAGRTVFYVQGCYECHGFSGVGRTPLDPAVSGILANYETFEFFLRLRADQNPTLPSASMPNYPENSLSDADARDLYAYIRTFEHDDPAPEEVPVLKAILDAAAAPAGE